MTLLDLFIFLPIQWIPICLCLVFRLDCHQSLTVISKGILVTPYHIDFILHTKSKFPIYYTQILACPTSTSHQTKALGRLSVYTIWLKVCWHLTSTSTVYERLYIPFQDHWCKNGVSLYSYNDLLHLGRFLKKLYNESVGICTYSDNVCICKVLYTDVGQEDITHMCSSYSQSCLLGLSSVWDT